MKYWRESFRAASMASEPDIPCVSASILIDSNRGHFLFYIGIVPELTKSALDIAPFVDSTRSFASFSPGGWLKKRE